MTQALEREAHEPTFVAAKRSPAVVQAVEHIVRGRADITEAHLVGMRGSRTTSTTLALIVLSEDRSVVSALEGDLRAVLTPHVRPTVVHFPPDHAELPWVRGLGGELKRESGRFPWWFLFLGI